MPDQAHTHDHPLELSGAALRSMMETVLDHVARHVDALADQPAHHLADAPARARALREDLPEEGVPLTAVLDRFFADAVPVSFNTAGPGYLAYIPGGGLLHTAVADFLADAVNRYTGVWLAAPALVQLETNVLHWLAAMVGYPPGALGILTSGGSLANFSAVVAARTAKLDASFLNGTLYASDQVHQSVTKAAALAGFPADAVRLVPSDGRFRLRPDALRDMITADRRAGRRPFLIVASGGTVNTGAVDDLARLADIATAERLWLHVDAAYGGFFVLTDRGRQALAGIDRADSVTLDPHKGLFLPYGTGCLLVRDPGTLRAAHAAEGAYLPTMQDDADFVDYCQLSPELSRPFRGLRLWLPLKLLGIAPFRAALDEKLDLARFATDALRAIPDMTIVAEPELSLVAFRLEPPGLDREAVNALNRRLLDAVNRRNRVYITGTTVRDDYLLRICVLSFRTHRDRIEAALEDVRDAVAEVGH